jgi:hypothetical protein
MASCAGYVAGRIHQMNVERRRRLRWLEDKNNDLVREFLSKLREPTLPPEPGLFDVPAEGGGVKPPPGAGDK